MIPCLRPLDVCFIVTLFGLGAISLFVIFKGIYTCIRDLEFSHYDEKSHVVLLSPLFLLLLLPSSLLLFLLPSEFLSPPSFTEVTEAKTLPIVDK